jgi:hypothetical protein
LRNRRFSSSILESANNVLAHPGLLGADPANGAIKERAAISRRADAAHPE